jgi:hypothetical protein
MRVTAASGGRKMACGEIPKPVYGKDKRAPMTRMGNLALQRAASLKVEKLQTDWARLREVESPRIATEAKARRPARARGWRARYRGPRAREIVQVSPRAVEVESATFRFSRRRERCGRDARAPGLETFTAVMGWAPIAVMGSGADRGDGIGRRSW